jgi:flagellar hook-length control protein FliK
VIALSIPTTGLPAVPSAQGTAVPDDSCPSDLFAQILASSAPSPKGVMTSETVFDATSLSEPKGRQLETEFAPPKPEEILSALLTAFPPFVFVPPSAPPVESSESTTESFAAQVLVGSLAPTQPQPESTATLVPTGSAQNLIMAQLASLGETADQDATSDNGKIPAPPSFAIPDFSSQQGPTSFSMPQIVPVDAASIHAPLDFEAPQLDLARDTQWLDQLTQDIAAAAQSEDQLSFRLVPRELGRMDVNLSTSEAGLSVKMSTSTEDARAIVASQQPKLIEELRGQGIRVAEAQVNTGDHRQRERNPRTLMPFIEVAPGEEKPRSIQISTRPQGRFA